MRMPAGTEVFTLEVTLEFFTDGEASNAARAITREIALNRGSPAGANPVDGVKHCVVTGVGLLVVTREIGILPPVNPTAIAQAMGFVEGKLIGVLNCWGFDIRGFRSAYLTKQTP